METDRDLLADPLRQLESLLQRIRTGAFVPDASRSGMVTESTSTDPASTYRVAPDLDEASNSPEHRRMITIKILILVL